VTESAKAYECVIRLLTRRAHSRVELLRKLKDRGLSAEPALEAVDRAGREGYVDDLEFARLFGRQARDLKGWAPLRLRQALAQRGVAQEHVEQVVEEMYSEVELLELALIQARKRAVRLQGDPESRRRRLAGFLQRRGFPAAVVRAATDDVAPF
jgi:regulatory protein